MKYMRKSCCQLLSYDFLCRLVTEKSPLGASASLPPCPCFLKGTGAICACAGIQFPSNTLSIGGRSCVHPHSGLGQRHLGNFGRAQIPTGPQRRKGVKLVSARTTVRCPLPPIPVSKLRRRAEKENSSSFLPPSPFVPFRAGGRSCSHVSRNSHLPHLGRQE